MRYIAKHAPFVLSLSKHVRGLSFDELRTNGPYTIYFRYITQKLILIFTVVMCFGFFSMTHGMNMIDAEKKELWREFKKLPFELQQKIRQYMIHDAIHFMGYLPITLQKHTGPVFSVAMDSDYVITGSGDNTAIIWDLHTGALLHTLHHVNTIRSVAIRGSLVFTGSEDKTVKIWDIKTGIWQDNWFFDDDVFSVIIQDGIICARSPDVVKIYVISDDKFECDYHCTLETNRLISAIHIEGNNAAFGTRAGCTELWDIENITCSKILNHTDHVIVKAVARQGNTIVMGLQELQERDRPAEIWDIETNRLFKRLDHGGIVEAIAISNDKVVTGSNDKTAKIWDIKSGLLERILDCGGGSVCSVAMQGNMVVTGLANGPAKIWPVSLHLEGKKTNPLVWIRSEEADLLQIDFIKRAYEATKVGNVFLLTLPVNNLGIIPKIESQAKRDARIFCTLPCVVREYLAQRLNFKFFLG